MPASSAATSYFQRYSLPKSFRDEHEYATFFNNATFPQRFELSRVRDHDHFLVRQGFTNRWYFEDEPICHAVEYYMRWGYICQLRDELVGRGDANCTRLMWGLREQLEQRWK